MHRLAKINNKAHIVFLGIFSSPEPSGSQGELIGWP